MSLHREASPSPLQPQTWLRKFRTCSKLFQTFPNIVLQKLDEPRAQVHFNRGVAGSQRFSRLSSGTRETEDPVLRDSALQFAACHRMSQYLVQHVQWPKQTPRNAMKLLRDRCEHR